MANCNQFENEIFDYIDGLLPTDSRKIVDKHLTDCSDCSDLLNNLQGLKHQLKNLKPHKTSPDFDTVLMTRIRMERSLKKNWTFASPFRIPVYAATGALALLAAFFMFNSSNNNFTNSNSANLVPTPPFTSSQSNINNIRRTTKAVQKRVKFPMEKFNLSGGTAINSNTFEQRASSGRDSSRTTLYDSRIQPVEF